MKAIVLAGGSGTRMYPLTLACSKQMLPVYDKPMIYYPIYTLMSAGIRDILIISTPADLEKFKLLLKDGSDFGIKLSYAVQPSPDGLAQAFLIGKDFIGGEACAMVLGDNIFYANDLKVQLYEAVKLASRGYATVFGYKVSDPERFGVVEFDVEGNVVSIEEKPEHPKSNYCVTGLYFYPADVCVKASSIKPSARGELEITDLNRLYLNEGRLRVQRLGENCYWWDTGTFDSIMDAAIYVQGETHRHNRTICSPEALAYECGWITKEKLMVHAEKYHKTSYGRYLKGLLEG